MCVEKTSTQGRLMSLLYVPYTVVITWRQKDKDWEKIEEEFNASTTGPARTAKQLKSKYESVKKELKKKHSQYARYVSGTGGGPYVRPSSPPETKEEKVLAQTICYGIQGLSSQFDADGIAGVAGLKYSQPSEDKENDSTILDWREPNSVLLQTNKSVLLKPTVQNDFEHNYSDNIANYGVILTENELEQGPEHDPSEGLSLQQINSSVELNESLQPESQPWHSRRRPIIKKKKSLSSAGAKFEDLASNKGQLVVIQKSVLHEQRTEQREEHKKRLLLLDLQIEEQKMKNQLLQKQLDIM